MTSSYGLQACNWELTLGCTLHCIHCGSRAGKARPNELTLDECLSVAGALVSLGCKEATLIGGEVFRFAGWEQLSRYLTRKGVAVNIVTNGYRLGDREIEQVKRAKVVNVGVSIDGMAEHHNQIRGRNDAFASVARTLDLLKAARIPAAAVTSLTRFNCADLPELYDFLAGHGVRVWQLQLVVAAGNMTGKSEWIIEPEQVRDVIGFIRDKAGEGEMQVVAADSIGYFDENETYIRGACAPISCWGGCAAGTTALFIDSIGNVKGCGALYDDAFIEGNVRETPLAEIWNSSTTFRYNRTFTTDMLTGNCAGCAAGELCRGGCRAANHFSTGSLYANAFCSRPPRSQ